ncbi:succinylglutamate desuccinylase/aspartoacylase family protein [Fulvivirgaceae bacterium PWU4]|uniref:Succinylglutamate desuccinylase/aspartoacylase family protein n=1 Tax=Chryseosolibacter histidini TaxID=2782349 RepID=A0AAP2GRM3_9BACT|nr:succinylglutamate desuccinylase/aspartoacylase family protein [Chryseosolibacter histidini]MBT1699742.1 succinylglutamate desuccinylase/aspartoacylase family protein [Chryseosolibacter histidini]
MKEVNIAGQEIRPGEFREININIARLPSHTQIDTPIYVSRAMEDGPVLALMAGMHGDEINGMEVVRRILDRGLHQVKRGAVVCMPIINVYGFLNYSRDVPDGKDVNRSFPGSKSGSLASRVAYHLMHDVIPFIDYGIDFHTGGAMRANYPQVRAVLRDALNVDLANAFSAPFTIDAPFRPNSLRREASRKGKNIIVYEGGESLRFDTQAIEEGVSGTLRLMKHLNMIDWAPEPKEQNRVIWTTSWVRAKHAGLFQPNVQCGQLVHKGEWVGTITDPFGEFKEQVKAHETAYVIGMNNSPVINAGDALMHLGMDNYCKLEQANED